MLNIFKRNKKSSPPVKKPIATPEKSDSQGVNHPNHSPADPKRSSLFTRLKEGLKRTRTNLGKGLANLILGKKSIGADLFEEIETQLLLADVGIEASEAILDELTEQVNRKQLTNGDELFKALKQVLKDLLKPIETSGLPIPDDIKPYVILVVGVNGVGKTTTIGKLTKRLQDEGKKVVLAAGDTFRVAAIEQLRIWAERNQTPLISQQRGADSASVIYDAVQAARARKSEVVIADTAGRLHTKQNLMDELRKIKRVVKKLDESAPHEVMLVLDATIGQNSLNQAVEFNKALGVTSIVLTKLDGTAKGGIIFALAKTMALPVRFIGIGEGVNDLRSFNADDFVNALFD